MGTKTGSRPARRTRAAPRHPDPRGGRMLALSAAVLTVLGAMAAVVFVASQSGDDKAAKGTEPQARAYVGGDLHTLAVRPDVMYVGGHDGVAVSRDDGHSWEQIRSLGGVDAMGWAFTPRSILVGGHGGLRRSIDGGRTFQRMVGVPVGDVHGLGAAGRTVYLSSPDGGLLVSRDAGETWALVSEEMGGAFMGTMLVDPVNPSHLLAPDMQNGVVESTDGGRGWRRLGGPRGTMAIAWDERDHRRLLAIGMTGGARSSDAGRSWTGVDLPDNASAVAIDPADPSRLYAAKLTKDRATVYISTNDGRDWRPL